MNKKSKKWLTIASTVTILGTLTTACGNAETAKSNAVDHSNSSSNTKTSGQAITMRIGISGNEESDDYKGCLKFKELLNKYSNGTIQLQIYPSAQLGGDVSMMQQLQSGALEAASVSTGPVANIVPDFALLGLPFLFKDDKVADTILKGPVGQSILDELPAKGMVGLTYEENGFRDLTNSKHPIKTLNDLQGIKLRVMQVPLDISFWRALGANPTPMAFDQVFNALQQDVVDAEENPITQIFAQKFYEVQKYVTLTNHTNSPLVVMTSKIWWDKLSPEQQQAIKKASSEAGEYERQVNQQDTQKAVDLLKAKGMIVDTLSDEELAKWRTKLQPIIEQYTQKNKDMANKLFKAVKQAEGTHQ